MYEINWYRLDEHREISDFITCAEYQLFLDEMQVQNKFYQPAHWQTYQFPKGQALQPILGIYSEGAETFCEWLNQKVVDNIRDNIRYRLPTLGESKTFIPQNTFDLANWCKENNNFLLHWMNNSTYQKIEKEFSIISILPTIIPGDLNVIFYLTIKKHFTNAFVAGYVEPFRLITARLRTYKFWNGKVSSFLKDLTYKLLPIFPKNYIWDYSKDLTYKISEKIKVIYSNRYFHLNNFNSEIYHEITSALLNLTFEELKIDIHPELEQDLNLNQCLHKINKLFLDKDYSSTLNLLKEHPILSTNAHMKKRVLLLNDLLLILINRNPSQYIIFVNNFCANVSNIVYEGLILLEKNGINYTKEKQAILNFHWQLIITNARMEGKLPAWEGLKIVREKKFD